MKTKDREILFYLVDLYKYLYSHKDLFKINFKYSIDDIEDLYKQIENISNETIKNNNKKKIRDDIFVLKTPDDIKKYLFCNNQLKEDLLEILSLSECSYIYNIIYSSPLKSNMRKIDAINTIEKYFNSISRAVSMKP